MLLDLEYFQKNHINAVRTSHYPNQIPFYYMCDEMGIYMMAETNLESHGSWQKMGAIENRPIMFRDHCLSGKKLYWIGLKAIMKLLKNHTSILFWSLGNESVFIT